MPLWLAIFALSLTAFPQIAHVAERWTSVEGITEHRLANGLRVLLFPDASQPNITVNVTYLVGSRHEGYGETGMAHLLEHMVFQGSPRHPDIDQEFTERGARANGTTWYDRTNYYETFPASEENLEWALDLEADRMVRSFISGEDLESEMTVVRNEFEMGENYPQWVLMERILSTAYLWHNYGKSTIGARSDIENVPVENLKRFYETWYQPDNAILVVAGSFDESRALELVEEKLGSIPRPDRKLRESYTIEPAQDGERSVTLRRVGDVQMVGASYHVPAGAHPDFAAVDLLAFLLGDTPSGRLHGALVESQKAASVFDNVMALAEPGVAMFFAEVRKDKSLTEARDVLLHVIEAFTEKPPSAAEIERARQARLKDWDRTMRASEDAAIQISEWAAMGDWRLMFLHRDRLKEVTAHDVMRVASSYFVPSNRTVGLYVPTSEPHRAEIPGPPGVEALVADYRGGEPLAAGESFDPSPDALEARLSRTEIAPGLAVTFLPKQTRGDVVQLALVLHFGDEASLRGKATAAELAADMLERGTGTRSRQEIRDELSRLRAELRVSGGATSLRVGLEVSAEHLEEALELVVDMLRTPSFPASELALLKEEVLARIEDSRSDPFQMASTTLERHYDEWPSDDPRYVGTPDERVAAVETTTVEEVRQFHRDFYGSSRAELAAVGDFDPDALRKRLEGKLAGFSSAKPYERLSDPVLDKAPLVESLEAPDKESAVLLAGHPLEIRDEDPDYAALELGTFLTGGGFLSSRIPKRLREIEGLSYGAGCGLRASAWEKSGRIYCYAIYAPQNSARLVSAFREEIEKILEDGFTEEEVAAGKKGWLEERRVSRGSDQELASWLRRLAHEERTMEWEKALEAKVESLTPEEILDAMRRHVRLEKMSMVQAGDFARASATKP